MDWKCNSTLNEYNVHGDLLSSRSSVEHARPQGLYSRYSTFTSKSHSMPENGVHKVHRKHVQHLRPLTLFAPPSSHIFHHDEKPFLHSRMHQFPRQISINNKPGRWCAIHGKIAWTIHFKKQMRRLEPKFYSFQQNISQRNGNFNHFFSSQFNSFFSTNDHHGFFHLKPYIADKRTSRRCYEYRKNSVNTTSLGFHDIRNYHYDKLVKSSPANHKESLDLNGPKDGNMDINRNLKSSTNHLEKLVPSVHKCQRDPIMSDQSGKRAKSLDGFANQNISYKFHNNDNTREIPLQVVQEKNYAMQKLSTNSFNHSDPMNGTNHLINRRRANSVYRPSLHSVDDIKKEPHSTFPSEHKFYNNYCNSPPPQESESSADDIDEEVRQNIARDNSIHARDNSIHHNDCRDRINLNCQSLDHISAFSVVSNSLLDLERKTRSSSSDSSTTSCFESFKSKLDTRYVKNFQTISNLLPEPTGAIDGAQSQMSRMSKGISPLKRNNHRKSRKIPLEHACDSRYCHKIDISSKVDEFLPVGPFDVIGHPSINGESGSSSSENKNTVVCPKGSGGSESSWSSGQSNNRSESEGNSSGSLSSNESPTMDGEEDHSKPRKVAKLH